MKDCCCDSHSGDNDPFEQGVNSEPGGDQSVARCCKTHNPWKPRRSKVQLAWTITKLKCTRILLRFFMKIHIWWVLRNQRKVQPSYQTGQRTREEVREAVKRIEKKK